MQNRTLNNGLLLFSCVGPFDHWGLEDMAENACSYFVPGKRSRPNGKVGGPGTEISFHTGAPTPLFEYVLIVRASCTFEGHVIALEPSDAKALFISDKAASLERP